MKERNNNIINYSRTRSGNIQGMIVPYPQRERDSIDRQIDRHIGSRYRQIQLVRQMIDRYLVHTQMDRQSIGIV